MDIHYGIDFGTSNSAVSVRLDKDVMMVPIEGKMETMPSMWLYDYEDEGWYLGSRALARYNETGGDGRFIQAIKTYLGDRSLRGTWIEGEFVEFNQLVRLYLQRIKAVADEVVGEDVRSVTIGRPVIFSVTGEDDLAEKRIREAAIGAGFENVDFMYEPLAATYSLKDGLERPVKVLTLDIGGGTTDISVVDLNPRDSALEDRVLLSAGVNIGGNDFTSAIMRQRLLTYFGAGSTYLDVMNKESAFPTALLQGVIKWYTSFKLIHDRKFMEDLRRMKVRSFDRQKMYALEQLVTEQLGLDIFLAIEEAKKTLSYQESARVQFSEGHIDIDEEVTRAEFEEYIGQDVNKIFRLVGNSLEDTGLQPREIDTVFLVGGSSKIPVFRERVKEMFPQAEIDDQNQMTSVAYGLSVLRTNN